MKYFLVLTLFLFPTYGYCQFGMENVLSACEVFRPNSIVTADLNGDGRLDIIFSAVYDQKIAWFANEGNGNYT